MSEDSKLSAVAAKKKRRNALDYRSAKSKQDQVLLRLDKGDRTRLDAACAAIGLSRTAFARLYLMPLADGLATKLHLIEQARATQNVSLSTFLSRAIEQAINVPMNAPSAPAVITTEFDALFGLSDGGG